VGFCGFCGFCGAWLGVDQEPRRGGSATLGAGRIGVDATHPAVLLQQGEGGLQVGGFTEAAAGGGCMGVAAAELGAAGAADPVQQPAGIIDARVGAHQVEHRPGVLDQIAGQPNGADEGVGADGVSPPVAQMAGQV
jgi:hypothetical protein